MTDHCRQDYSSASEEPYPYWPGSSLSKSQEVEYWCQSLPNGLFCPPTPPDTVSDCFSDCPDMSGQAWTQTSLPEEPWTSDRRQNVVAMSQPCSTQSFARTFQDVQAIDGPYCPDLSQGSVASGLSPSLSHSGQSPRTLNSFSEPEFQYLPPSLDLTFALESNWPGGQPEIMTSQSCTQPSASVSFAGVSPIPGYHSGRSDSNCTSWSQPDQHVVQRPCFPAQGGQTGVFRQSLPQQVTTPKRTLLPRTESLPTTSGSRSDESRRTIDAQVRGQGMSVRSSSSVSSVPGQQAAFSSNGHRTSTSKASDLMPLTYAPLGLSQSMSAMSMNAGLLPTPPASMYQVSDSTADDFSAFIQYDQDDNTANQDNMSYHSARVQESVAALSYAAMKSSPVQEVKPVLPKPDRVHTSSAMDHDAGKSVTADGDEGRHRTHPLYSRGPAADGLYYCPYKDDPDANCTHKPTKLKCNHDKYIDSHLKPFRCKLEACSKQEFSSTACLLRHEREAHGMHGHGDRPHLCYYPGCERGTQGNGFPRRYNLFDHMKRVHDHKEDVQAPETTPVTLGGDKKATGRKRKGPGNGPATEPPAQRTRTATQTSQSVPSIVQVTPGSLTDYHPAAPLTPPSARQCPGALGQDQATQAKQRLYAQWNNRKELLARQMERLEHPEDVSESTMQRFNRDVEEFRRLSEEAKRG